MRDGTDSLILNPQAELTLVKEATDIVAVRVRAPRKGLSLVDSTIERAREPGVFGVLLVYYATGGGHGLATDLKAQETSRLADIGMLIPPHHVPDPVWFSCDLDDPPLTFVPRRAWIHQAADDPDPAVVNPTFRQLDTKRPPRVAKGSVTLPNRFRVDRAWCHVEPLDRSAPSLYSYRSAGRLDGLRAGQPPPDALTSGDRQHLSDAGVLLTAQQLADRTERAQREIAAARDRLRTDRYAVLRHVVAPFQLGAIRRYYRELIAEGFLPYGDAEWPHRYFSSRDPIAHYFHQELAELVSQVAGERLKSSFAFFASYRAGSDLPAHRDRDQCVYSLSLLLDYSPEPDDLSPWPIYVQPPDAPAPIPIDLGIGDALLYHGREVRHHRDRLGEGQSCSLWFLFYVPEDFEGPLDELVRQ